MTKHTLKWVNALAYIAMITVTILAEKIPLGGKTTAEISFAYPNLFAPAPYTFSIWIILYILMGFYVLDAFRKRQTDFRRNVLERIGLVFAISCLFNIGWLLAWHYERILLSVLCMLGLLITAVLMMERNIDGGAKDNPSLIGAGIDMYAGWITVATIANVSVFLVSIGWDRLGLSESFWTCTMLVLGTILGAMASILKKSSYFTLTVLWTYVGILIRHMSLFDLARAYPLLVNFSILGIVILMLSLMYYAYAQLSGEKAVDPTVAIRKGL